MDDTTWLTAEQLTTWRRLMALLHLLPARLEEALRPHGLSFFEYSVMAMLSDAPDMTLRMSQLAAFANASPSRLSHAAGRLESRGWLVRAACAEDGRVTLASLTEEGLATMARVAPDHVTSVRTLMFDDLDVAQVRQLGEICSEVLARVAPDVAPPWVETEGW